MKKTLYYVTQNETYSGTTELNGIITVTVYDIVNNKPMSLGSFDTTDEADIDEEIQLYIDDNGYGDEEITFVQL